VFAILYLNLRFCLGFKDGDVKSSRVDMPRWEWLAVASPMSAAFGLRDPRQISSANHLPLLTCTACRSSDRQLSLQQDLSNYVVVQKSRLVISGVVLNIYSTMRTPIHRHDSFF
jgi:hypothetical protein